MTKAKKHLEDVMRLIPGYDPWRDAEDCWVDHDAAQRAIDFFHECLVHIEGDCAGKPFLLEPWQQAVIANLFGWYTKDSYDRVCRRYRRCFVYIPRKCGKALDVDTPIPTVGGWKRMGDLAVGDVVFDHNGTPTTVIEAFPVLLNRECYEVFFSDGTSIVCDGDHLWETKCPDQKSSVKTTLEIKDTLHRTNRRVEYNHRIPVCGALEMGDQTLPMARLKPYPQRKQRSQGRHIVSVAPVSSRPVRCIAVDSPRQLYLAGEGMVPTHNTPLGAGILNYMLFADGEYGAQCYGAAAQVKQADLLFRHASGQVQWEPFLLEQARVYKSYKSIELNATNSFYRVVATNKDAGLHGQNIHFAILDELHAFSSREAVDTFETAISSKTRLHPLIVYITTADYQRISVCNQVYDRAVQVRDGGLRDKTFLPVIYELTKEEAEKLVEKDGKRVPYWTTEEAWFKTNPNLGISKSLDYMKHECEVARTMTSYENRFKRLDLNIRTEQEGRWLSMERWHDCGVTARVPFKHDGTAVGWRRAAEEWLKGATCEAAIDLGSSNDLTALMLLWKKDGLYFMLPWFWVPKLGAEEKEREHQVPYLQWSAQGFITQTPGEVTDYNKVLADILELSGRFAFALDEESGKSELAIDATKFGVEFCVNAADAGLEPIKFGQWASNMSPCATRLEELVTEGVLRHGSNPVLDWMAGNAAIHVNNHNQIKIIKPAHHEPLKVDGIVAGAMALGQSMKRSNEEKVVGITLL